MSGSVDAGSGDSLRRHVEIQSATGASCGRRVTTSVRKLTWHNLCLSFYTPTAYLIPLYPNHRRDEEIVGRRRLTKIWDFLKHAFQYNEVQWLKDAVERVKQAMEEGRADAPLMKALASTSVSSA